jgi:hypothetical protein
LQKHLLLIHAHGIDYPNAGSLVIALTHFYQRLIKSEKIQNPRVFVSIAVDIAYNSPRTFPACSAIISKLLQFIEREEERTQVLELLYRKLLRLPNTGLMEVWLQRIAHFYGFHPDYSENLCKIVRGEKVTIWNNDWINDQKLKDKIDETMIFDVAVFNKMRPVVLRREIELFAMERY